MRRKHRVAPAPAAAALIGAAAGASGTAPAAAHPLGNFSVNHYHGLRLHPDRVDDLAILDEAEIPTRQNTPRVDADGAVTDTERSAYATATCQDLAAAVRAEVNGGTLDWTISESSFIYQPGAGGLPTGRTKCRLTAPADLHRAATVSLGDSYRSDRIGWREITATGDGVTIADPTVPATSISDELRHYPNDVLTSPLDQRSVQLWTTAGGGIGQPAAGPAIPIAGPIARAMNALTSRFDTLAATPHLTPLIGLLAICPALLLGAAHAALPGHGKTVMAAYIAGKRGTLRDALTVGVTVTATHTAGVLALGLALTLATGLAGETLLGWLGVASGLLIAAIGTTLLRSTRQPTARDPHTPAGTPPNRPAHTPAHPPPAGAAIGAHAPAATITTASGQNSDQDGGRHGHGHHDSDASSHHPGHHHHGHVHHADHGQELYGRRRLIGLGVAGGLVPSPSALIVLLGAIALGRTWFGVMLVIAYGAGMAATLTTAGLLLVHLGNRLDAAHRVHRWSHRWAAIAPLLTASLVLIVGLGLAIHSALPLLGTPP